MSHETELDTQEVHNVNSVDTSRLNYKLIEDVQHFIYLVGNSVVDEEPYGKLFNTSTHYLKFGQLTTDNTVEFEENVSENPVYPYNYDFEIDSSGNVHTAFVHGNYTLAYAVRDINTGQWNIQNLTKPDELFAISPVIELGNNELPRIAFKGVFKENITNLFNFETQENIAGSRTIFYMEKKVDEWDLYDVGDNHKRLAITSEYDTYYPEMEIIDGKVHIAYTTKIVKEAETRLYFLSFSQQPTTLSTDDEGFFDRTHKNAMIAEVVSTIYPSANIMEYEEGIVLVAGAYRYGGVTVSYLPDLDTSPKKR